jgi:hypothetical protein
MNNNLKNRPKLDAVDVPQTPREQKLHDWFIGFEEEIKAKLSLYESLLKAIEEDIAAEEVIINLKWILGEPTEPVRA